MTIWLDAAASEWYVDSDAGDDGNSGASFAAAMRTLEAAYTAAAAGDVIYYRGSAPFRKPTLVVTKAIHFIGVRSPALNRPMILGTLSSTSDWSLVGDEYRRTIDFTAAGFAYNWINSRDLTGAVTGVKGARYGHYARGTYGSLQPGQWDQSGTTLSFRPAATHPAPADSAATPYEICRAASGIEFTSVADCGVYDTDFGLHLDPAKGMHAVTYQCQRVRMVNCRGWDSYDHAFSAQGVGGTTRDVIKEDLTAWGNVTGGMIVDFNAVGAMVGNRNVRVRCHTHHLKRYDGENLIIDAGFQVSGLLCHSGASASIDDLQYDDCEVYDYGTGGNPIIVNGTVRATLAGDAEDPASYAVRYIDCRVIGGSGAARCNFNSGSISLVRTRLDIGGQTGSIAVEFNGTTSLAVCCDVIGNLDSQTAGRIVSVRNNAVTRWRHCALTNAGTTLGSNRAAFRALNAAAQALAIDFRRGVISRVETLIHAGTFTASQLVFENNVYNIASATGYNGLSEANWKTQVDTSNASVYGIDPEIKDPAAGTGAPREGGLVSTATLPASAWDANRPDGINRRAYTGHYGPWQYGETPEQARRVMSRGRTR